MIFVVKHTTNFTVKARRAANQNIIISDRIPSGQSKISNKTFELTKLEPKTLEVLRVC